VAEVADLAAAVSEAAVVFLAVAVALAAAVLVRGF